MDKIGSYKILYNEDLIVEYYAGEITVDDLIRLKEAISKEPNYDFYSDTILDFRPQVFSTVDAAAKYFRKDSINGIKFGSVLNELKSRPNSVL